VTVELDFESEEFRSDPYPVYARLRREAPVARGDRRGFWLLTRHADVISVLRDPRSSVDRPFQPKPPSDPDVDPTTLHPLARALRALSRVMLFRDPPDHTRLRGLVSRAFTPRTVLRLRPRIQGIADELLAEPLARGSLEAIGELAAPLPLLVIAELLGLPREMRADLKRWSDDLAIMLDGSVAPKYIGRAVSSAVQFVDYLRGVVAERRRAPQEDLISDMLAARDAEAGGSGALDEDEVLGTSLLVLAAGHETTTHLIGNGLLALLRHPEEQARLRADPKLLPVAVEEMLRFEPPVQATSRVVLEDVEIGGVRIPAGDELGLILAAANRDPEIFAEPDRFDVARADNPHLSFGFGIHFCLGAALARLECEIAIATLLARTRSLALAADRLERRPGFLFRGVEALPVALAPAGERAA
jgi:hypothetical protein